jgi:hypothetical protein
MAHWAYLLDNPFTIFIESIQRMTPNEGRCICYKTRAAAIRDVGASPALKAVQDYPSPLQRSLMLLTQGIN